MLVIKHYFFLVFVTSSGVKMKKIFMQLESNKILKILGLFNNITK